jgi:cytosine/adenosine deaminase-related metal-dependent hydrolase
VHGTNLETEEIRRIALTGAPLCLCPRSNEFLGVGPAPVAELLAAGIPLCLGTDSRASNRDLGIWGEMRAIRRLAPHLSPARILAMATLAGARALGFADRAGSLAPGLPAKILFLPAENHGGDDPAEALLAEEVEARVRWLLPPPPATDLPAPGRGIC